MNWTHCFWGVGATLGPLIMTKALTSGNEWRLGYGVISVIQLSISALIYISILKGYWDKQHKRVSEEEKEQIRISEETGLFSAGSQVVAMLLFFFYSGMELSMGVWTSSVLIESRHMPVYLAGLASAFLYAMIMVGRLLSGFIVSKIGNKRMIRADFIVALAGMICIGAVKTDAGAIIGIILVGLGFASIFPGLMYETPIRFKKKVSDQLIGYQVGAASLGGSAVSSVIGVILSLFSLELLYPILILLLFVTFLFNEILSRWAAKVTVHHSNIKLEPEN
jgi:fucose permease